MEAFIYGGTTYVEAQRVNEHLALIESAGFISYYHSVSPIPEELSSTLLLAYADHLSALMDDGPELNVYEHDRPYGNYFMIYQSNDHAREAGIAYLQAKSDKDADGSDTPRNWRAR